MESCWEWKSIVSCEHSAADVLRTASQSSTQGGQTCEADFFSYRIVEGVEILARILHPEVVHQRAPENSVLKLSLKGGQRCRQRLIQNYFLPFQ